MTVWCVHNPLRLPAALRCPEGQSVESVQFSDSVIKVNKRGKNQERDLIITNLALYNFLPNNYKQCQREIRIQHLKGIVLSKKVITQLNYWGGSSVRRLLDDVSLSLSVSLSFP